MLHRILYHMCSELQFFSHNSVLLCLTINKSLFLISFSVIPVSFFVMKEKCIVYLHNLFFLIGSSHRFSWIFFSVGSRLQGDPVPIKRNHVAICFQVYPQTDKDHRCILPWSGNNRSLLGIIFPNIAPLSNCKHSFLERQS